jgi:predicted kinase
MMSGVSGSGKSWLAERLLAPLDAFRVRSDVERKRRGGLDRFARTASGANEGIYSPHASAATYARLSELAMRIVAGGHPAIVDATFLTRSQRAIVAAAAARAGVPCVVVDCHAPLPVLETRVIDRRTEGRDVSEADVAVLRDQLETREPIRPEECDRVVDVDTSRDIDLAALAARIGRALEAP